MNMQSRNRSTPLTRCRFASHRLHQPDVRTENGMAGSVTHDAQWGPCAPEFPSNRSMTASI